MTDRQQRPRNYKSWAPAVLIMLWGLIAFACSAANDSVGGDGDADASNSNAASAGGGSASTSSGFNAGSGGDIGVSTVGNINGVVRAPEGTIPIHDALIYLTKTDPAPIPQEVFCDSCIELADGQPYALSNPDGTFQINEITTGVWKMVVQKGAFRRVREITVVEGDTLLDLSLTTLPGMNGAGDDIPKMAVVFGDAFDKIENTLAKLGLGSVDTYGDLVGGTEQFDLYSYATALGEGSNLLTNYADLSKYHIVFFPCSTDAEDYLTNTTVLENLRNYVTAGGRLYVTDWAYEVLNRAFPDPITWIDDDGTMGSAQGSIYDAPASVSDPGLVDWLIAQGIGAFDLVDNWTQVASVQSYQAPDENGTTTTFDPTVWVNGDIPSVGVRPATLSFQYGCGRALFSTYHTEGENDQGLMPQEKALLYILLETAVCIGDIEPPK